MRAVLLVVLAALLLAGCAMPSQPSASSAGPGGGGAIQSAAAGSAPTANAPISGAPERDGAAPAITTHRVHAEGSWTASAHSLNVVGTPPPKFSVPAGATAGTLTVTWSAQAPAGLHLTINGQPSGSLWKGALTTSPSTFTFTKAELETLKDAAWMNVYADDTSAAAAIDYKADGEFLAPASSS